MCRSVTITLNDLGQSSLPWRSVHHRGAGLVTHVVAVNHASLHAISRAMRTWKTGHLSSDPHIPPQSMGRSSNDTTKVPWGSSRQVASDVRATQMMVSVTYNAGRQMLFETQHPKCWMNCGKGTDIERAF
jgi:hypothetical protein